MRGLSRFRMRPFEGLVFSGLILLLLLMLVPSGAVHAQGLEKRPSQDALTSCGDLLQSGDLDGAIKTCSEVAEDASANKEQLKEALRLLGRAHLLNAEEEPARETMANLIQLEPPVVELPEDEYPPLRTVYYEVRKELSDSYEIERNPGVHTMAIMGFTNTSLDDKERYDPLEWGIASMLIGSLSGATELKVVERERLKWILDEHSLQSDPAIVDQSTAVRMGKLLGAQTMLFGSITVMGKRMRVDARLVNVETSEVMMTAHVAEEPDDFLKILDDLSLKIATELSIVLADLEEEPGSRTKSLDAQLSYSQGLVLIEEESYDMAYAKFMEALEYDPDFVKAKHKAVSISPLLAAAEG